ncbi:MAG: ParB N-terminal domain-containing protein, partial [Phycisphaerae bacterium]|nr:ParB N-terminal domain-containing protein [Phycisphaerae bacterium]
MKIEMLPIDSVCEFEGNPRRNDAAVGPVARSIKEFGFRVPVIVDRDNVLVAGQTRVKAARQLGLTEVPAVRADDLTPEQVRAFRVADNKLHELSDWDIDLLAVELAELKALEVDLDSLGFGADELAQLLDPGVKEGECDPDHVPEPPDEAVTQPGDLWLL